MRTQKSNRQPSRTIRPVVKHFALALVLGAAPLFCSADFAFGQVPQVRIAGQMAQKEGEGFFAAFKNVKVQSAQQQNAARSGMKAPQKEQYFKPSPQKQVFKESGSSQNPFAALFGGNQGQQGQAGQNGQKNQMSKQKMSMHQRVQANARYLQEQSRRKLGQGNGFFGGQNAMAQEQRPGQMFRAEEPQVPMSEMQARMGQQGKAMQMPQMSPMQQMAQMQQMTQMQQNPQLQGIRQVGAMNAPNAQGYHGLKAANGQFFVQNSAALPVNQSDVEMNGMSGTRNATRAGSEGTTVDQLSKASVTHESAMEAVKQIPWDALSPSDRQTVQSLVERHSIYRRLPMTGGYCNPEVYDFLLAHPEIVVGLWRTYGYTQVDLQNLDNGRFTLKESNGTTANLQILYQDNRLMVFLCSGVYQGQMSARPIEGEALVVMQYRFTEDANNENAPIAVTRLDTFARLSNSGADFVSKAFSPVIGKIIDSNFVKTVDFVNHVSETIENNPGELMDAIEKIDGIDATVKQGFLTCVDRVSSQSYLRAQGERVDYFLLPKMNERQVATAQLLSRRGTNITATAAPATPLPQMGIAYAANGAENFGNSIQVPESAVPNQTASMPNVGGNNVPAFGSSTLPLGSGSEFSLHDDTQAASNTVSASDSGDSGELFFDTPSSADASSDQGDDLSYTLEVEEEVEVPATTTVAKPAETPAKENPLAKLSASIKASASVPSPQPAPTAAQEPVATDTVVMDEIATEPLALEELKVADAEPVLETESAITTEPADSETVEAMGAAKELAPETPDEGWVAVPKMASAASRAPKGQSFKPTSFTPIRPKPLSTECSWTKPTVTSEVQLH